VAQEPYVQIVSQFPNNLLTDSDCLKSFDHCYCQVARCEELQTLLGDKFKPIVREGLMPIAWVLMTYLASNRAHIGRS